MQFTITNTINSIFYKSSGGVVPYRYGYSEYWTGTKIYKEPYVARAPLNFNTVTPTPRDYVIVEFPTSREFDPTLDDSFYYDMLTIELATVTRDFFILYDTNNTTLKIFGKIFRSGSTVNYVVQANDGTGLKTMIATGITSEEDIVDTRYKFGFDISGDPATKSITPTIDGVLDGNTEVFDFTGIKFNRLILGGSSTANGALIHHLGYGANCNHLGILDLVSNEDDGKTFVSSKGYATTYIDSNDNTGQYPNYTLPEGVEPTISPATNGIQNNESADSLIFIETDSNLFNYADGDSYIRAVYTLEPIVTQKATLECSSVFPLPSGDGSSLTFAINPNGKFLYLARDASNAIIVAVDGTIVNAFDGITKYVHEIIITNEGGTLFTFDFYINGVLDKSVSNVDLVNGFNINHVSVDGTGSAPHIGKVFSVGGSKFKRFDLNTRLLPQGENQLERTNEDGKVLTVANTEQVFPYFEIDGDPYLISDNQVSPYDTNYSEYYNGFETMFVEYETSGPINLNGDQLIGHVLDTNFSDKSWEIEIDFKMMTDLTLYDSVLRLEDEYAPNDTYIKFEWHGNPDPEIEHSNFLYVYIHENGVRVFGQAMFSSIDPSSTHILKLVYDHDNNTMVSYDNGNLSSTANSVDLGTSVIINRISVGSRTATLATVHALYKYLNISLIDEWDLYGNEDFGGTVIGNRKGTLLGLLEGVPLDSLYPYNGNESVLTSATSMGLVTRPKADGLHLSDEQNISPLTLDPTTDFVIQTSFILDSDVIESGETIWTLTGTGTSIKLYINRYPTYDSLLVYYTTTNTSLYLAANLQLNVNDVRNIELTHRGVGDIKTVQLYVNGKLHDTEIVDFTNSSITSLQLSYNGPHVYDGDMIIRNFTIPNSISYDFIKRLKTPDELTTQLTYTDTISGNEITITQAQPKTELYPYKDTDTWELVRDVSEDTKPYTVYSDGTLFRNELYSLVDDIYSPATGPLQNCWLRLEDQTSIDMSSGFTIQTNVELDQVVDNSDTILYVKSNDGLQRIQILINSLGYVTSNIYTSATATALVYANDIRGTSFDLRIEASGEISATNLEMFIDDVSVATSTLDMSHGLSINDIYIGGVHSGAGLINGRIHNMNIDVIDSWSFTDRIDLSGTNDTTYIGSTYGHELELITTDSKYPYLDNTWYRVEDRDTPTIDGEI